MQQQQQQTIRTKIYFAKIIKKKNKKLRHKRTPGEK